MPIPVKDIKVTPARHCPSCGHDVTVQLAYGTFTCPECGNTVGWRSAVTIESPKVGRSVRSWRTLAYAGVVILLAVVFLVILLSA